MILLSDTQPGLRYFYSVLETDLPKWLALGWVEHEVRDRKHSVKEDIVLIEWQGSGNPPQPAKHV